MSSQPLTSAQRKQLRGLAHDLKPIAQVGRSGITDALVRNIDQAIEHHELVKVRFMEHRDSKSELTGLLAERLGAQLAGIVGHVAIFYRPASDEEARRISLG